MSNRNKNIFKNILILLIALSMTTFLSCFNKNNKSDNAKQNTAQTQVVVINQAAPNFTAVDSLGKKHALSDYKGKIVVLEWKNSGCPFVKKHYDSGNMQETQRYALEKDVVWFSVISSAKGRQGYVTKSECNEDLKEENSKPTAVLLDPKGELGQLYNAKVTPHIFIINKNGDLAYQGAIDSIASADQSDISEATNYAKTTIDALINNSTVNPQETRPYGCSVKY